jgi:hypothetical protein
VCDERHLIDLRQEAETRRAQHHTGKDVADQRRLPQSGQNETRRHSGQSQNGNGQKDRHLIVHISLHAIVVRGRATNE